MITKGLLAASAAVAALGAAVRHRGPRPPPMSNLGRYRLLAS
jgi:hypothetical protein